MALIHRNVKNTIIMFQCKTYFNTCWVWIIMLVSLLVEVDMFSIFPYYGSEKRKKTILFDIKCQDSYLMKCLHNNTSQNDTICWHIMYLTHLVSNIKTTSSQCYTSYVTLLRNLIRTEEKSYDKSVHIGEEPYIYDFIIVRLINKSASQKYPLSNLLVKINHFGHR